MCFLPFSELINIDGPWLPSFAWKEVSPPFEAIVAIRVGPTGNCGLLLGQEKCSMAPSELSLACLRVHKEREPGTLHKGLDPKRTLVLQVLPLLPLGSGSAGFLTLDLPLFYLVPCSCRLRLLIYLSFPELPSYILWWLEFGLTLWSTAFLTNSGSIFTSNLFPYPGPLMLSWMQLDGCLTLANFSWFGYQQELQISVSTWNTLNNKHCSCL